MSKPWYQVLKERNALGDDIHYVKPVLNEQYLIIPKEDAQTLLKGWRDITKTTNERKYPFAIKINQSIYARMYGGYGTVMGGVVPGTEEYFNQPVPPGANSLMGNKVAMTPKQFQEIKFAENKKKKKENNAEIDYFNEELNKLKEEAKIAEESGKPEISKILKEKIIDGEDSELADTAIGTPLDGVSALGDGETSSIVGDVTGGGAPVKVDKPNKSKIPPIIISHNEGGDFIMGAEDDDVTRKRDIGLYSSKADNRLRFYRDGGFELHSSRDENSENLKMGSQIVQDCINAPLHIISNGDIHVSCAGTFSVDASRIVLKSNAVNETGINIDAEADVRIQAGRDYLVTADNITIDAKERIVSHSEGWQILIGQYIRLHEPQTKICPAFLTEYIEGQIKTLKT